MKRYIVKSSHEPVPLVEVRTDGQAVEFIIDNTNGKLPQMIGNDFRRLRDIVNKSSHLSMEEPRDQTVNLLRYLLDNGDVVEISTDGKTALLNGKLLGEHEKQAIFKALESGMLTVKEKTDIERPLPILPKVKTKKRPEKKPYIDPEYSKVALRKKQEQQRKNSMNSYMWDDDIENFDFSKSDNPALDKGLAYLLRYGVHKGSTTGD